MDEDMHIAIGRLAIAGGDLEFIAFAQTRVLLGGPFSTTRAVAQKMQFGQLMDLNQRLVTSHNDLDDEARERWREWASRARKAMNGRNEVLHAWWDEPDDPARAPQAVSRGLLKQMDWTVDDINARVIAAVDAYQAGVLLMAHLPTYPDTRP